MVYCHVQFIPGENYQSVMSRFSTDPASRRSRFPPHPFVLGALLLPAAQGQAADLFTPVAEPPPASITAGELTVRLPGAVYEIRSVGDELYAVSEMEEPPFECEVVESHSEPDHSH